MSFFSPGSLQNYYLQNGKFAANAEIMVQKSVCVAGLMVKLVNLVLSAVYIKIYICINI